MPVTNPLPYNAQMAVSVQKRQFKRAVQRNLLKRRIREAYRTNKNVLYEYLDQNNVRIVFMIIYTASDILEYKDIENKIIVILRRLKEELSRGV